MEIQIRPEHEWLHQLVGEWSFEAVSRGPEHDQRSSGTEAVRGIGDAWVVGEMSAEGPDGQAGTNLVTLGFDSDKGEFVGTFIGSMMTSMWLYRGHLSADRRTLVLDTEGPDFSDPGVTRPYQDRIEVVDRDHRVMSSHMRDDDGNWQEFMQMRYTRTG